MLLGSPAGLDDANTNAWSATTNSGRDVTGSVVNAVSAVGCVDAVGRVWEWLNDLITRAEHAKNTENHPNEAWGWDTNTPLKTGEKNYDVGNIYQYYYNSLAALRAGGRLGRWRAVWRACGGLQRLPVGCPREHRARGACDSL